MKNCWFFEKELPKSKQYTKVGVRVKKKLFSGKSRYQKIEVFDTYDWGKILVLDGIIQLSEKDEFIYHEMISQPALFSHPNPKRVLIIGGGDGGVLREVLKHPVKEVYLVDIDKKVIEVSQKYFPFISKGAFNNKKVRVFIENGIKFVKDYKGYFDVVIIDSTDPQGPSFGLFSRKFYQDVRRALREKGIIVTQSGSFLGQVSQIKRIYQTFKKLFSSVQIHRAWVPCYQWAEFAFTMAGKKIFLNKINLNKIEKKYQKLGLKLKYYTPQIHSASSVLPAHLEKEIKA